MQRAQRGTLEETADPGLLKKIEALEELKARIRRCKKCPDLPDISYPLLRGNATAKILLVSQAPSKGATIAGCLWKNSKSGETMRKEWLRLPDEIFYNEDIFYITSLGKCYPGRGKGGDKPPPPICARTWLVQELQLLSPRLIITVGKRAFHWFFPTENYTQSLRGEILLWQNLRIFPLPHPSGANNGWKARHREQLERILCNLRKELANILEGERKR